MKTKTEIQLKRISDILKRKGSITTKEAIKLGVLRLASRIFEAKERGMKIKTLILSDRTAKYILVK